MASNKTRILTFRQFIDAKGELPRRSKIDYSSMSVEQLEKYIDLRRQHGADMPTHKTSMSEILRIYDAAKVNRGLSRQTA